MLSIFLPDCLAEVPASRVYTHSGHPRRSAPRPVQSTPRNNLIKRIATLLFQPAGCTLTLYRAPRGIILLRELLLFCGKPAGEIWSSKMIAFSFTPIPEILWLKLWNLQLIINKCILHKEAFFNLEKIAYCAQSASAIVSENGIL